MHFPSNVSFLDGGIAVGEIVNVLDIILRDKLDDLEEDSDSGSFSSCNHITPLVI